MAKKKPNVLLIIILFIVAASYTGFLGAFVTGQYTFTWQNITFVCTGDADFTGQDSDFSDGTMGGYKFGSTYTRDARYQGSVTDSSSIDMYSWVQQYGYNTRSGIICEASNLDLTNIESIYMDLSGMMVLNGEFRQSGGGTARVSVSIYEDFINMQTNSGIQNMETQIEEVTLIKQPDGEWLAYDTIHATEFKAPMTKLTIESFAHAVGSGGAGIGKTELYINDIIITCDAGYEWEGGQCVGDFYNADLNGDGVVDRNELSTAIQLWLDGTITRDELGTAINQWVVGTTGGYRTTS